MTKCDDCRAGAHTSCTRPSETIEGENEGGLDIFRVCCCNWIPAAPASGVHVMDGGYAVPAEFLAQVERAAYPTIAEQIVNWISWQWMSRVWLPLHDRCSFCGTLLLEDDDDPRQPMGSEETGLHDLRGARLGWGRWLCQGCTEYPEG
jgi:hypothetical protein